MRQGAAAEPQTIFLSEGAHGGVSVVLHPVVLFSVVDHYTRRPTDAQRVIGVLLGSRTGATITVTDSFAVPHEEGEDGEVSLGKTLFMEMLSLRARVDPSERVVGWYATAAEGGAPVNEASVMLHEFFASESDVADPVHVVVDASLSRSTLQARAFVTTPAQHVTRTLASQFRQVPLTTGFSEAERVGVTRMLQGRAADADESGASDLAGDLQGLESAVARLLEVVSATSDYVDGVVANGGQGGDVAVGRAIADALASVPSVPADAFREVFEGNLQDLLTVAYLSNLTRAQLAISEKLHFVA